VPIKPTDLVDDVMNEWPATIRVFLDRKMLCVGCPMGRFHTVADACREHGLECAPFLADLQSLADRREMADGAAER
jgi:hybrid cluster-associated redox disulfide protein